SILVQGVSSARRLDRSRNPKRQARPHCWCASADHGASQHRSERMGSGNAAARKCVRSCDGAVESSAAPRQSARAIVGARTAEGGAALPVTLPLRLSTSPLVLLLSFCTHHDGARAFVTATRLSSCLDALALALEYRLS